MSIPRLRVAAVQYYLRPIPEWDAFYEQVSSLVATAADYKCQLIVFPEYFTVQLLTLKDVHRDIREQVRDLSSYRPQFIEMFVGLARRHEMYIVAGTIPAVDAADSCLYNDSYFFGPSGKYGTQGKLHMTRFETADWSVSARKKLRIFETSFGKAAIAICYDVEFPEIARAAARKGADLLIVPSHTDDRQGFYRVRYCAHARAIENQMYVVNATTVGSLPMVPDCALSFGQASILTPSDFPFARDGILAEGVPNQESMIIGELNMETIAQSREFGTVLPLNDSVSTAEVVANLETEVL